MRKEFGKVAEMNRLDVMGEFMSFKRRSQWDVRKFWRKYKHMVQLMTADGVLIPGDISFTQCLKALEFPDSQRRLVLSSFEQLNSNRTVEGLRDVSVRLFGTFDERPDGVFLANDTEGAEESSE